MSIFFILSGFVLAYRYASEDAFNIKGYITNRFGRIYPIYLLAAIVTLPWLGVDFGNSTAAMIQGFWKACFLIFTNIFLIQAWFPQLFSYWNDGASWSISVEVFCYALFPFILQMLTKASKRQLFYLILLCYFSATLPGISVKLFDSPSSGIFYSMPIFRLSEFVIGICIYLAIRAGFSYSPISRILVVVYISFFVYLGILGPLLPIYVGHNWVSLPLIALMIQQLATKESAISKILSGNIFVWLGKISYSFYSFQALIILALISYHEDLVALVPILSNNKILAFVSIVLLIVLSAFCYHFIETPLRRSIRKFH
jgi:peptidoglycan/LPS O-acetylase OafA/YrhL